MSKYIFMTDTHFRVKSPVNRTDDILESLFSKVEYVLQYSAELNAKIIHGGDLFHTPSIPDFVATRLVRLFKKYESEVYFIIGNHDVTGANCDTYDYSKIGLMAEYKWFHLLGKRRFKMKDHYLCGYDFSKVMECPTLIDPVNEFKIETNLPIICCVHSMITDEPAVLVDNKNKTINWASINSTASVVLTGHYHPGWDGVRTSAFGTDFVNPGAIIRQEGSEEEIVRKPKITILDILDGKVKIKFNIVPHKKDVFNLESIVSKKASLEQKNLFIEALNSLKDESIMGNNVLNILESIKIDKLPKELQEVLTEKILNMCKNKVKEIMDVA